MPKNHELTSGEAEEFDRRDSNDPRGGAAIRRSMGIKDRKFGPKPGGMDMARPLTRQEIGAEQARAMIDRIEANRTTKDAEGAQREAEHGEKLLSLLRDTNPALTEPPEE